MSLSLRTEHRRPGRVVGMSITTPASNAPLLPLAKEHLAVETTATDVLLQRFIDSAVRYVELAGRVSLFDQTRKLVLDSFPDADFIQLYSRPLKAVTAFVVYSPADVADSTFAAYSADVSGCRVLLNYGASWPTNLRSNSAVHITYTTGHGTTASALPPHLIQAVMLIVGNWYANRESAACGTIGRELVQGVSDLLGASRELRI